MGQPARRPREPELKRRAKTLALDIEARERRRLKERLRLTREAKKRAIRRIRVWASEQRKGITAAAVKARARCRERIRRSAERQRQLVNERKTLMLKSAQRKLGKVASTRRAELERELAHQRMLQQRERKRITTTRKERAQESDDSVRKNIDKGLVPIFERVKRSIRGSPRRSRTEAFLEWVQEHPDQVLAIQAEQAERDVGRLVAEQHEAERRQARGHRVGSGILSAVWRGKAYELKLRPIRKLKGQNVHQLEVRCAKRKGSRLWEATHRLKDDDWELGKLLRGPASKEDRAAVATWVDTLDGWNPLDDLSDVAVGPVPF